MCAYELYCHSDNIAPESDTDRTGILELFRILLLSNFGSGTRTRRVLPVYKCDEQTNERIHVVAIYCYNMASVMTELGSI